MFLFGVRLHWRLVYVQMTQNFEEHDEQEYYRICNKQKEKHGRYNINVNFSQLAYDRHHQLNMLLQSRS